jgi:peptide/nickel transport system substrate-binding protein
MNLYRRRVPLALICCAVIALSACGGSGPAPAGPGPNSGGAPGPANFEPQHGGGTLLIDTKSAPGTLDPQINYDPTGWQIAQAVYDGLLAYQKTGGPDSAKIVPDLATAMPTVTDGGTVYHFTLRPGMHFSTGQPVTVADVQASFRRIFKASGPTAGTFYQNIAGAAQCLEHPEGCDLPGVAVDPATNGITITLTRPDAEFPAKLAVPHAAILPASTPGTDQGINPVPGTGPYAIASFDPNSRLVLKRNPHFTEWSRTAQPRGYPDEIDYRYGLTVEAAVTEVENGQANWVNDPLPADRLNEIGTKYANQVHLNPQAAFWYLPLNVNLPPFNNPLARQAVEWAVDRSAVVRLFGGSALGTPVCTILPPSYPEHVDYCAYTKGPPTTWSAADLTKAQELVQQSGTKGQPVALVVQNDEVNLAIGGYLQSLLNQIGYQATLKPLSQGVQFPYLQNSNNKVQISVTQWYEDYPAASDFLNVLLSCNSYHPGSDSSINISGYCDKDYDAALDRAMADQETNPAQAKAEWGALDRRAMDDALIVPLFTPNNVDFVSAGVGNYLYSTAFGPMIDQMWVK